MAPKQDLVFYTDGSLVPPEPHSSISIISHVQGTAPTWLVNTLIENALVGSASGINHELKRHSDPQNDVLFVSFSNNKTLYSRGCKKNGIDLENAANFTFLDMFTDLFTKHIGQTSREADIAAVFEVIEKQLDALRPKNCVLFIESPEILLSATSVSSSTVLFPLLKLSQKASQVFVIVPQDKLLVDLAVSDPLDPVFRVSDFLAKLHYRTSLNVHLQPLSTGRASDITGCLTVSRGSVPCEKLQVAEKEYIFHVTKESAVALYHR